MSLASVFASGVSAAEAAVPTSFTGPGGVMSANVDNNGNCVIVVNGMPFTAPGAVVLAFAAWATATFT